MTCLRNSASAYQFLNFLSVSIPEMRRKHRVCSRSLGVIKMKQTLSWISRDWNRVAGPPETPNKPEIPHHYYTSNEISDGTHMNVMNVACFLS